MLIWLALFLTFLELSVGMVVKLSSISIYVEKITICLPDRFVDVDLYLK